MVIVGVLVQVAFGLRKLCLKLGGDMAPFAKVKNGSSFDTNLSFNPTRPC